MSEPRIQIDPKIRKLIPPLLREEYEGLTESIKAEGCRDALVLWNDTLIDGHNRYEICTANGIEYKTVSIDLPDHRQAELWVLKNAKNRRNLTDDQRAAIEEEIRERESAIARSEQTKIAANIRWKGKSEPCVSDGAADTHRPKRDTRKEAAKRSGVSQRKMKQARKVKNSDPGLFAKVKNGEKSLSSAANEIEKKEKEAERTERAKKAEKELDLSNDYGVRRADFRELAKTIPDGSVDLIFTDPPYDRKTLPLYSDLAQIAQRILVDGGSLICYLGQYQLPEVIQLMSPPLRYWWMLAIFHSGGTMARMREYGIIVNWKPLLWLVKGTRSDKETYVDDYVSRAKEKTEHEWQQPIVEAKYYIERLCPANGLVFDPFCGAGTTSVAAKMLTRKWLTCDIDERCAILARKRLQDTT